MLEIQKLTLALIIAGTLLTGITVGSFGGYKWGSNATADKPVECAPELKRVLEGRK